ncbi:MAG: tetratricopeptide repeat protein [Spirochaetes bacterium]|nr:tetratricopeptide repeat protein [Spirochaetota bacterium]
MIIFILLLLMSSNGYTRVPVVSQEEVLVGTRPLALNGAYVAMADDVTSIGWNPAGLAFLKNNELTFSVPLNPIWSRDLDVGFNNFYGAVAFPLSKKYVIAVDWLHIGYSDDPSLNWNNKPELEYNEERVSAAFAMKFSEEFRAGTSLKYYNMGTYYDGSVERKGHGFGMDIGIQYIFSSQFRMGLLINNVFTAVMFYDNSEYASFMSPAVKLGAAYSIIKDNTIELTLDDMVHLGVEHWFFNMLALRGGAQKELLSSSEPFVFGGGLGIKYDFLQVDYALNYHPAFKLSHNVSATYRFGYEAYLVDVLDIQISDVFASQYKSYSGKDMITVKVKNKTKKPLKAKIGFYLSGYMDSPTEKSMVLKGEKETEVILPMVFNNQILDRTGDGAATGKIIITYEKEKQKMVDEHTKQFMLYSRNAFIWENLEKLAVFVTPQDENIKEFTRGVMQLKSQQDLEDEFISDNYYYALLLFVALGEYGMTYVVDPDTPFAEVSKKKDVIDYVQFPVETMKTKTGDCDDLTVLYSSCLANIGIPCAFIDVPGHIYMMFYLGISSSEAGRLLGSRDYFIDVGGDAWLAVETTMIGRSFIDALKEGQESLQKWSEAVAGGSISEDDVRIVFVTEAWKKFPSSQPDEDINVKLPEWKKINKRYQDDIEKILSFYSPEFSMMKKKLEQFPQVAAFHNQLGIFYARNNLNSIAEKYFLQALTLKKDNFSSINNLGNIYLLNAQYKKAIEYYKRALRLKPDKPGVKANLKKAQQLLDAK